MSGSAALPTDPTLPVTYAMFVAIFPEFADTTLYPPAQVNFWIAQGMAQMNAFRFGTQLNLAVMLFVAHSIVLSAREIRSGAGGQVVGNVQGPLLSKSIGPISASYSGDTAIEGAGAFNFTSYGQRLYNMMLAYAAGPKYVPGPRRMLGSRAYY